MAVRTAYAPVAASVLTAANLAKVAGGWIGYNEVTANQGSISTTVDLTSLEKPNGAADLRQRRCADAVAQFS